MIKPWVTVIAESTCLKRVTVCELYAADGSLLARESNRCDPPNGLCCRIGVSNGKSDYPSHTNCNWTHAEVMALRSCEGVPVKAIIYGHDFACPDCEDKLKARGVTSIEMVPERCGVR